MYLNAIDSSPAVLLTDYLSTHVEDRGRSGMVREGAVWMVEANRRSASAENAVVENYPTKQCHH